MIVGELRGGWLRIDRRVAAIDRIAIGPTTDAQARSAAKQLVDEHEAQLLNYLKSTRIEVGLLLNFGPKPEVKRRVYDNERKGTLTWLTPMPAIP